MHSAYERLTDYEQYCYVAYHKLFRSDQSHSCLAIKRRLQPRNPTDHAHCLDFKVRRACFFLTATMSDILLSRIFYYFGEPYDAFLLVQACIMIVMQIILLHVALRNRPLSESSRDMSVPFSAAKKDRRPYNFWQWRSARPYWLLIIYFTVLLGVLQALLGRSRVYVTILGYFALTMEALLPIPQIISNHTNRSCKGFRLSVLLNWLLGDVMKMTFFFLSESAVPVAFKACGFFQWACDIYLGIQYRQFGTGA